MSNPKIVIRGERADQAVWDETKWDVATLRVLIVEGDGPEWNLVDDLAFVELEVLVPKRDG